MNVDRSEGTSRQDRYIRSLQEGFFYLDELDFSDMLVLGRQMASQLTMVDENGEPSGTWESFFDSDDIVIMAIVRSIDTQYLDRLFKTALLSGIKDATLYTLDLMFELDRWLHQATNTLEANVHQLDTLLDTVVRDRLTIELHRLGVIALSFHTQLTSAEHKSLSQSFVGLDGLWAIEIIRDENNRAVKIRFPQHDVNNLTQYQTQLRVVKTAYSSVISVIRYLKQQVDNTFETTLTNGEHHASFGLYMAFINLYERGQAKLNQFTQAHIDFYYQDVLKNKTLPLEAGSVYVTLAPMPPNAPTAYIDSGIEMTAGLADNGEEIIYKPEQGVLVSDAQVVALKTLGYQHDIKVSPERRFNFVTGITQRTIFVNEISKQGKGSPLFGITSFVDNLESASEASATSTNADNADSADTGEGLNGNARVGFAIASSVLLLNEGRRDLQFSIYLKENYENDVDPKIFLLDNKKVNYGQLFSHYLEGDSVEKHYFSKLKPSQKAPALLQRSSELFDTIPDLILNSLQTVDDNLSPETLHRTYLLARLFNSDNSQKLMVEFGRILRRYVLLKDAWLSKHEKLLILLKARLLLLKPYSKHENDWAALPLSQMMANIKTLTASELTGHNSDDDDQEDEKFWHEELCQFFPDEHAQAHKDKFESYKLIREQLGQEKEYLFYDWMRDVFTITLTTEAQWLTIEDYFVEPIANTASQFDMGLCISMSLAEDIEPISPYLEETHGAGWQTQQPIVKFQLNANAPRFAYSILQGLNIKKINIDVDVSGVKELVAYNQYGRLDPSKPFAPFGPLPTTSSYLVVGNHEMAMKSIVDLSLHLKWTDLPATQDGFIEHYRDYQTTVDGTELAAINNHSFQTEISVLSNHQWLSGESPGVSLPFTSSLFESEAGGLNVSTQQRIDVPVENLQKPITAALTQTDFDYTTKTRNGFYRLSLTAPAMAFGHALYPELLTQKLTENARHRKQKPLPKTPYTPTLMNLTLSYRAHTELDFLTRVKKQSELGGAMRLNEIEPDQVFHLNPFGMDTIYPQRRSQETTLLPSDDADGNLLIGIKSVALAGTLSLYFDLADDSSFIIDSDKTTASVQWHYMAEAGWVSMPEKRVLSDSTLGFVTAGIVVLDLPHDISSEHPIINDKLFWLKVSARKGFEQFSSLKGVVAHGVKLEHSRGSAIPHEQRHKFLTWAPRQGAPGLGSIQQQSPAFDGSGREDDTQMRVRLSERLRHKQRASTVWDYERLVLGAFPEVNMIKCIANCNPTHSSVAPGHITVVVVPHWPECNHSACSQAKISSALLRKIYTYLNARSPDSCQFYVMNPVYERIQVRCSVKFDNHGHRGQLLKQLNQEISDFLCPWTEVGGLGHFDWRVKSEELASYLSHLDYVDFVTDFSMLRIVLDEWTTDIDDDFMLSDTAEKNASMLTPKYRWSLPVPSAQHFITVTDQYQPVVAEITGIDELEIGRTFVVQKGKKENAETS